MCLLRSLVSALALLMNSAAIAEPAYPGPPMQSSMRWDILRDFEPVSLIATVE